MKRILLLLALALVSQSGMAQRIRFTINDAWKFHLQEQNASATDLDDRHWETVSFPHTWNALDTDDETPGYYRGKGWYRRMIRIDEKFPEQRIYLQFEGANQQTTLYINGQPVGSHTGGYTAFTFDITNRVFPGDNLFVIEVDNSHNPDIPPLSADYTFYGGVYRDVYLTYTPAVHISTTHYASSGVYLRTQEINGRNARISATTMLNNDSKQTVSATLRHRIEDESGNTVAQSQQRITLRPGALNQACETSIRMNDISRWDIQTPTLYRVYTTLTLPDGEKDQVVSPLGIRTFEFSPDRGFQLNGRPVKLIGTNRHQDYLARGNALPDAMHERDIRLLKEMGGNFLRVSHYPQDPVVMQMCDRLGIVTSVEIPIVNAITESEAFQKNCLQMALEMIYQNYNYPSVVIWGYMNEVLLKPPFDKNDPAAKKRYYDWLFRIASALETTFRTTDPTRYTMLPCHSMQETYIESGIAALPKILGFNIYDGWYRETFDHFEKRLAMLHELFPNQTLIVSEYGADVDPRIHSFQPERYDFSCEYGNLYHEHYLPVILQTDYVAGASVWNLNDFYSEDRGEAVPHVNNKGLTGLDRSRKDSYYLYQATLCEHPVLHICSSDWKLRGGAPTQTLKCYTNANEIEVRMNGDSIGRYPVRDHIARFQVTFTEGENELAVCDPTPGRQVRDLYRCTYRNDRTPSFDKLTSLDMLLGTNRMFEDSESGTIWAAEQPYTPGSWGYVGGKIYRTLMRRGSVPASDAEILGTRNDPIYQTRREGIQEFRADVPDGQYAVYLHFAELNTIDPRKESVYNLGNGPIHTAYEERRFNLLANGREILHDVDIAKQFGALRAVCIKVEVQVENGGGLRLEFQPIEGEPFLNAIRIYREY